MIFGRCLSIDHTHTPSTVQPVGEKGGEGGRRQDENQRGKKNRCTDPPRRRDRSTQRERHWKDTEKVGSELGTKGWREIV